MRVMVETLVPIMVYHSNFTCPVTSKKYWITVCKEQKVIWPKVPLKTHHLLPSLLMFSFQIYHWKFFWIFVLYLGQSLKSCFPEIVSKPVLNLSFSLFWWVCAANGIKLAYWRNHWPKEKGCCTKKRLPPSVCSSWKFGHNIYKSSKIKIWCIWPFNLQSKKGVKTKGP